MKLQQRIDLLLRLGSYINSQTPAWEAAKNKAFGENNWFIPEFVNLACRNISEHYLSSQALNEMINRYPIPETQPHPQKVGIVMAGNIPLVGFHDFLCVFLSGHIAFIKPSVKDDALIRHLVETLHAWEPATQELVTIGVLLKNCDAYIATGSNNSSRYFEFYFKKYPTIIRKNRTSAAILTGNESSDELQKLADDIFQYFGLGCRNVTKLYVPEGYDFIPLLQAFDGYHYLNNHNKFKNNYDYNLAVHILNNKYYMTNGAIMLVEDPSLFSPIAQVHYEFYKDVNDIQPGNDLQCLIGSRHTGFGSAQVPGICDYADGVDTMSFLLGLKNNLD